MEQAAQFGTKYLRIGQLRKQGFDGVQDDTPGPDALYREMDPDKQTFQVECAALFELRPLNVNVLEPDLFPPYEVVQIKPQGSDVCGELFLGFLERNEGTRLIVQGCSPDEKFHRQQCLAATGTAAYECGSPLRYPTSRDFVQSLNARWGFCKCLATE